MHLLLSILIISGIEYFGTETQVLAYTGLWMMQTFGILILVRPEFFLTFLMSPSNPLGFADIKSPMFSLGL